MFKPPTVPKPKPEPRKTYLDAVETTNKTPTGIFKPGTYQNT